MFEFHDVQEAAAALPDLQFEYQQLQAGSISVEVNLLPVEHAHVTYVRLDRLCEGRGQVHPGRLVFVVCRNSPASHLFDNNSLHDGQTLLTIGARQSDSLLRPGFEAALFNFPESLVANLVRLDSIASLPDGSVFDLSPTCQQALLWLEQGASLVGTQAQRHISDAMARYLCHGLTLDQPRDLPNSLGGRLSMAKAIRDRLREGPDMTWGDICHELSISERTFRRVFADIYDVSPGQYQLAVRLNRVRNELKRGLAQRGTVSEVACRHGFWHMGRFGTQYRRLFGEAPRETLLSGLGPRRLSIPVNGVLGVDLSSY